MSIATAPTNAQIRANLFALSPVKSMQLPSQTFSPGDVKTFILPKTGIGLYVTITVTATISRTETATVGTATFSPLAPFNVLKEVALKDYSGIPRVVADGYMLYLRQVAQRWAYGAAAEQPNLASPPFAKSPSFLQPYSSTYDTASMPAGVASSTVTAPLAFQVDVPISLHENTTVGTFPFTVPKGDVPLQISTATMTGATLDSPVSVTGATTVTLTNASIAVEYFYLDPPQNVPLPVADFAVVHELVAVTQTSGILAGQNLDFELDTGRKYYALYSNFVANNAPDTLDISSVKFLINQTDPAMDDSLAGYLARTRKSFGRDLPPGAIVLPFSRYPWMPSSYGSLLQRLVLDGSLTVGTNAYLRVLKESTYQVA